MRSAALVLILAAACAPTGGAPNSDSPTMGQPSQQAPEGPLPIRELLQEHSTGYADSARLVIRDAAAWANFWRRVHSNSGEAPALPAVDFAGEMVLAAAMGTRATGGYTIHIDSARIAGEAIEVFVRSVSPGPTCGTTAAITEPVAAVATTRSDLPPRFIERRETRDC